MSHIIFVLAFNVALVVFGAIIAYRTGLSIGRCQRDRIDCPASWLTPRLSQDELIKQAKRNRRTLRKQITPEVLRILEARFKTHLPAFQRTDTGNFDPLAAAHRDGAREVFIYIRQQLELAETEAE